MIADPRLIQCLQISPAWSSGRPYDIRLCPVWLVCALTAQVQLLQTSKLTAHFIVMVIVAMLA